MKSILTFISILFFQFLSIGQDVVIQESEVNKDFVDLYNASAKRHTNKDSIYFYYNKSLLIAQKINYGDGQIVACKGLIELNKDESSVYEKLRYSLMLVSLEEKYGNENNRALAYLNLADLYYSEHLYTKAEQNYLRGSLYKIRGHKDAYNLKFGVVKAQKNLAKYTDALSSLKRVSLMSSLTLAEQIQVKKERADICHELKAYEEELSSYRDLLPLIKGTEFQYLEPTVWNNIGYTEKFLGRTSASKEAFKNAIESNEGKDLKLDAGAFYNLGLIYQNEEKPDSSKLSLERSNAISTAINDYEGQSKCLNLLAMVYYQDNDQFNAGKTVEKSLTLANNYDLAHHAAQAYEIESFIHQELFEFEEALVSYKKYLSIRDSLATLEQNNKNKMLFDQYRFEQIEKQLRLIWAKSELDAIDLARVRAEKEVQEERFRTKEKENQLALSRIKNSELQAREQLQELLLMEERLKLENKNNELSLIQRDNELKEMALERERMVISQNQKEIELLAQENELERQERLNEEREFQNKLKLVFGALLFIFLILLGILIAYRQLRKRKKKIELQSIIIAKSKAQIEIEKEKSEGLLLNILPIGVAEELKANGSAVPKSYNNVVVGFTDFAGFTMISEKMTAEELVHTLDAIFNEFDMIIDKYGLQRIKTIGDAYMFASGLDENEQGKPIDSVLAALEIRDCISGYNANLAPGEPQWNVRIGLNSGPVVAGVIGTNKFAYDIWGDAVNIASRMESSGEIGKVNISGATYEQVKADFKTEHRGKIKAKNKGEIDMYFVEPK